MNANSSFAGGGGDADSVGDGVAVGGGAGSAVSLGEADGVAVGAGDFSFFGEADAVGVGDFVVLEGDGDLCALGDDFDFVFGVAVAFGVVVWAGRSAPM